MSTSFPRAYFDHAASAPLVPEALAAMLPFLDDHFANPSGIYAPARAARRAVDDARDALAAFAGCAPDEIVFTSGGTESDNLAVQGAVLARRGPVVVSAIEHDAVLRPAERLGAVIVPACTDGSVDLDALEKLVTPDTVLVSVIAAQSETGAVQVVGDVVARTRRLAPDALVHTDAVQAAVYLEPAHWGEADLVSLSAHKIGGPKGVGALVVRARARERLVALVLGGGQERELRAGTENVAAIAGFAAAASLRGAERTAVRDAVSAQRDRLEEGLRRAIPSLEVTEVATRAPGHLHVRVPGIRSEEILIVLDELGVDASAGSACASGALEPSHVLVAMGWSPDAAREALRLTLGWSTTDRDVDRGLEAIPEAVARLR